MLQNIVLFAMLGGVGNMLGSTPSGTPPPPVETFSITTEAGDLLTTEAGDILVTEDAP